MVLRNRVFYFERGKLPFPCAKISSRGFARLEYVPTLIAKKVKKFSASKKRHPPPPPKKMNQYEVIAVFFLLCGVDGKGVTENGENLISGSHLK